MMKFKAVIFDLDGTLVNSLQDIADSMNIVLQGYNYPTHSYEEYKNFIGSGIRSLVGKSLPLAHNNEKQIVEDSVNIDGVILFCHITGCFICGVHFYAQCSDNAS